MLVLVCADHSKQQEAGKWEERPRNPRDGGRSPRGHNMRGEASSHKLPFEEWKRFVDPLAQSVVESPYFACFFGAPVLVVSLRSGLSMVAGGVSYGVHSSQLVRDCQNEVVCVHQTMSQQAARGWAVGGKEA